jgi:DNA-binding response OmpR family regulator
LSDPDREAGAGAQLESVLLVDSDVLERLSIAGYLRDCGFKVIEASTAEEAMHVLGRAEIAIDVVLSDIGLDGDMDGFGLARWIRSNKSGPRIILAATAERAAELAGDLCEEGPLLAKPYDPKLVLARIRQLLAGGGDKPSLD